MKIFALCIGIGYLFGCINGAQIIGRLKKINIKESGIKNAGASNTTLLLGWKYGVIVGLIDIFKAVLSILLVSFLLNRYGLFPEDQVIYIYLNALFVILGHNYPITMRFSGGKGTASFVGSFLMIDWKIAFIGLILLLLLALATDYFVFGVLSMYLSFISFTYFTFDYLAVSIAILLFSLSMMKHVENYKRILKKEEIRLSSFLRKETL